jgi:tetratricopeptide (TPR) repeat protein
MKITLLRYAAFAMAVVALCTAGCGGAEQRKASYLEKGEKFYAARNFEKAHVEFRNALQIDPNDANARYHVGRAAERLNNPREAVGQYQAAIDSDPNYLPARAALARLFLLGGLADKALELAEPGLTQDPKNAPLLTVRGAARSQRGDVPGAFEDAEAAVKLAPDDEYAVALLASLYRQNARSDKAIEVVRAGLEKIPRSTDLRIVLADLEMGQDHAPLAEVQLKEAIKLQPEEVSHRYRLARFYLLSKNADAAERTLREAVHSAPGNVDVKVALVEMLASHQGVEKAEAELKAFAAKETNGANMQLALARFFETHRKPEQAEGVYRAIVAESETQPDGLAARTRLAALLLQKNEVAKAGALVEEVLKENPRDNDALVLRGNLALNRGDAATAIADLRAVLRDQPNSIPVMRALARAHLQNNELAIAEEMLRKAAESNPAERQVRLELAQLLAQSARPGQARPILQQLASEMPNDLAVLEPLLRTQLALKDVAAARATAENIERSRPDLPLGPYLSGAVAESEGKLDVASQAYERALAIQPEAAEPLAARVRIHLARKEPAQALVRLDKAIADRPDNVVARNLKGELLIAQGQADAAIATFEETLSKAPKWWVPYRGLALAQLSAKRVDMAIQALERGLKSTEGAPGLSTDLAALYERLGRPDDAIRVYEAMVRRDPKSTGAANNLAMLLVSYRSDAASLERAQQLTEKLSALSEPAFLNTRGWVKFKRGEYQAAVSLLAQAVEKSPESPVMRYHLGMAQWRSGDQRAARENLEAAMKAGASFMGAKEAQAALEELKRAG